MAGVSSGEFNISSIGWSDRLRLWEAYDNKGNKLFQLGLPAFVTGHEAFVIALGIEERLKVLR